MEYLQAEDGYWVYDTSGYPIVGGQSENLLDGFEDQSLSEYGGALGAFSIQNQNVLSGRFSLQSSDTYVSIGDDGGDIPTPRTDTPTEYQSRVYPAGSGDAIFCTNVQSEGAPFGNCYAVTVDTNDNELRLYTRVEYETEYLEEQSLNLSSDTEYRPFITLSTNGINGGVYDAEGSLIHRTESYRDTTHSGGGIGWRSGAGAETFFDHCTYRAGSMGDVSARTIDSFERGNLNPYRTNSSSGSQSATVGAAYEGNYGLEMNDYTRILTRPGDGLENYPRDGKRFELYVNFQSIGANQYYVFLCPESVTSTDNLYQLEFLMDGGARIQKDTNGSNSLLSGSATGNGDYAYAGNVNWGSDNWYRVEILLDSSSGVRVDVYDASSGDFLFYVEGIDTEYISSENGFGFYSSGSSNVYFDQIVERES